MRGEWLYINLTEARLGHISAIYTVYHRAARIPIRVTLFHSNMAGRTPSVTSLPPVNRYITAQDDLGHSIYVDSPPQMYLPFPGVGGLARSYAVSPIPPKLKNGEDMKAYLGPDAITSWMQPDIVTLGGATLLIVDLAPGGQTAMHQTVSIDFSTCVMGEVDHELDGEERVRLTPGDHIIQRGTMHRWRNASKTQPARLVVVTISCVPFDIAGKQLEEIHAP